MSINAIFARPCNAALLGLEDCWLLLWDATLPYESPP